MSQAKPNLNSFLNGSKKFIKKEKRSLSKNYSEKSFDKLKSSGLKKNIYQNSEQTFNKKNRLVNQEQDDYYEQRDQKYPLKKIRSIQSSQGVSNIRNKNKQWREESQEEQQQEEEEEGYYSRRNARNESTDNFQPFKGKAKQFIESLSRKINKQIDSINDTIEEFNRNIKRTVDIQYSKLRTAIKNAVEDVFENQEDNIKKLAKVQQKAINQQLIEVRCELQDMYVKLQKYKQGLDGPNWKKITGEILSNDIQSNVMDLIKRTQKTKILRGVRMVLDQRKEEAFAQALEQLLQVNFIGKPQTNEQSLGVEVN